MNKKLFIMDEAANFNKYISLITGVRLNASGEEIGRFQRIDSHILMAFDNSGEKTNLNYVRQGGDMPSVKEFYTQLVAGDKFDTFTFEDTAEDEDIMKIIIPGLFVSEKSMDRRNLLEIKVFYEDDTPVKWWYINSNIYRRFLNKIRRIPGAKIQNLNFIRIVDENEKYRFPICVNYDIEDSAQNQYTTNDDNIRLTNAVYSMIDNYNDFNFESLSDIVANVFLGPISYDFFISHQSRDKNIILTYLDKLRIDSPYAKIWFDKYIYREEWNNLDGDDNRFRFTMQHGIKNANTVVILLSRNYIDKIIGNSIEYKGINFGYLGVNYELSVILKEQSNVKVYIENCDSFIELIESSELDTSIFQHCRMVLDYDVFTLEEILGGLDQDSLFDNNIIERFKTVSQLNFEL